MAAGDTQLAFARAAAEDGIVLRSGSMASLTAEHVKAEKAR